MKICHTMWGLTVPHIFGMNAGFKMRLFHEESNRGFQNMVLYSKKKRMMSKFDFK